MDSFSPPTDNLYKFMALSGTFLIFLSIYLTTKVASDQNAMLAPTLTEYTEQKISEAELVSLPEEERVKRQVIVKIREDLVNAKIKYVWQSRNNALWMIGLLGACMAIGTVIAYYGYRFWYLRVQKFEDLHLQADAMDWKRKLEDRERTGPNNHIGSLKRQRRRSRLVR